MDDCFQNENKFTQKLEEYLNFKENIENRIEEIKIFYESHFDEPLVLNYGKGIIKLQKILMENKPNCYSDIDKYIFNIKNETKNNLNNSNQKIQNKNNLRLLNHNNENNNYKINDNNKIKTINESKFENNTTRDNNNNNSESILDNNIFNNKLLLRFQQKENELKNFEFHHNLNNQEEINNITDNEEDNNDINKQNNELEDDNNKIDDEKINKSNIKNRKLINIKNRSEYGELFNLKNTTSDKKNDTIKSDNNFSAFKENESNNYIEESKEEENSINEEIKEKFKLKEVIFKFILTDAEYNILIQERAKNINPFKDYIN